MKKFAKLAFVAATAVVAATANAQTYEKKAVNDNWGNGTSELVWKNGTNELCWRDASWTPATANAKCDGALAQAVAQPIQAPALAPVVKPATPTPEIKAQKVSFQADAFFDFDKAVLKPEGKAKLDDLTSKIKDVALEVIIAVGHTDSFGSDSYNQRLSVRRAEAVKAYLVSKGIEANRVYTEGKGEKQLKVAADSCKGARSAQIACQAPNRRVEIEVVGTRNSK